MYILCSREHRAPCNIDGEILGWSLAAGAVLVEDYSVMPVLESEDLAFYLISEIDWDLACDLEMTPEDLFDKYGSREPGYPAMTWSDGRPMGLPGFKLIHALLQDAMVNALIETETAFGREAVA